MEGFSWTVASLDGSWAELRQDGFLYVVPLDELPADLQTGDVLDARGSSRQTGYPVFCRGESTRRRATA